ncbi:MAG: hypothetical protein WB586_20280 [Chthoniobacterales bacterium]
MGNEHFGPWKRWVESRDFGRRHFEIYEHENGDYSAMAFKHDPEMVTSSYTSADKAGMRGRVYVWCYRFPDLKSLNEALPHLAVR